MASVNLFNLALRVCVSVWLILGLRSACSDTANLALSSASLIVVGLCDKTIALYSGNNPLIKARKWSSEGLFNQTHLDLMSSM